MIIIVLYLREGEKKIGPSKIPLFLILMQFLIDVVQSMVLVIFMIRVIR